MDKKEKKRKRKKIVIDLTVDNSNMDPLFLFKEKKSKIGNDKDYLSSLPEELIFNIMTYMCPSDLIQFICASKKYYRLGKDEELWRHMFLNCRIDPDSPLIKSMLKETGSWKTTFLERYSQHQSPWQTLCESIYLSKAYWTSISVSDSSVLALTKSVLDIVSEKRGKTGIEYQSCESQHSTYIKATKFPEYNVYFELPETGISHIFHDKSNDIIVMYHRVRGILIVTIEDSELKLVHEIGFQLSLFPVYTKMAIDFDNTLFILGISSSIYIFDYKKALNQEQVTPLFSKDLENDVEHVNIGHGYAYWSTKNVKELYNINTNEFVDLSSIYRSIYYPIFRAYKNELYLVSHIHSTKVHIVNVNKKSVEVIPCYRNIIDRVIPVDDAPELFITYSKEGIIKIWDAYSGKCVDMYNPSIHESSIISIFCKEDLLIACTDDDKLVAWNLLTKKQLFKRNYGRVKRVDYFNGKLSIINNKDRLWFVKVVES